MAKSRAFSIYLLKEGFDASSALKDDNDLDDSFEAQQLPPNAALYVLDSAPKPPWWKSYFGVQQNIFQTTKGALVIFPVEDRWFALSFGHVYHNLKDTSYEHDFGLRVTLNSLDPKRLKSTDALEPGESRRRRTQIPTESDLTFFDFDRDSTILKSLTGKVKDEYKEYFKHATGASNLKISTDVAPVDFPALCHTLLDLYNSDGYKDTFPDIQNILPVSDPATIQSLDQTLVTAIQGKDEAVSLTVPDIINYSDNMYASFSGRGPCEVFEEVFIQPYFEYLENSKGGLESLTIEDLKKKHHLRLTDEDGATKERHSIYKSLLFDIQLGGEETFHLADGHWYRVENSYIKRLEDFLDPMCKPLNLINFKHGSEAEYNEAATSSIDGAICLDTKSIAPAGETAVEPCDIYAYENDISILYHVKISTLSSKLSHQFNQGANSIELIKGDDEAFERLRKLIEEIASPAHKELMLHALVAQKFRIIFAIVTHKDANEKSKNLPLFSKISLMRILKTLRTMSVEGAFGFIYDASKE
jgi:uncharacterized protein (TIGR04141 family)